MLARAAEEQAGAADESDRDSETDRLKHRKIKSNSMKKLIVCTLAFLAAGAVAVRAADAKENWTSNCLKCHGADGKGQTAMGKKLGLKDYSDAKVQDALKDDQIAKAIKEGVKEGDTIKMKAFGDAFSADEIKALVAYVRGLKK
jgi:mono/diheme cytochrome c family protein